MLPRDLLSGAYTKPRLFLCETDKTRICQLETTETQATLKFNAYSELSFTVGRTYDDIMTGQKKVNPFYDKIEALRLIYVEGFGYFEIQDPEIVSDGIKEVKNVTAYSLEYTLSQKYIEDLKVNTGESDSAESLYAESHGTALEPVRFYNFDIPQLSLLNIILQKAYGWEIGYIDESLKTMTRSFDISRSSIYDFIMQEVCDKFNCYAEFDTINNKINFYAEALITKFVGNGASKSFTLKYHYPSIGTVTIDSYNTTAYEYNAETGVITFTNGAPKEGAKIEVTDGSQTKWITDVYITFDNLAQEVNITYSADDIKTVLTVKGADDLDIREVNMGLPYIVDLDYYYSVDWMGQSLYDKYTRYLMDCQSVDEEIQNNYKQMMELRNRISYENTRGSLQYKIANEVTPNTAGKFYVRGGEAPDYYYKEVTLPGEYKTGVDYYVIDGVTITEDKLKNFHAALRDYYLSGDSKDTTAISELASDYTFMKENTISSLVTALQNANTDSAKDKAINVFLDELWNQLGLKGLEEYYNIYKKIVDANIGMTPTSDNLPEYWEYHSAEIIMNSLASAKTEREATIKKYQDQYDAIDAANQKIQAGLAIEEYFKGNDLIRLSAFLREDEYKDDYIEGNDSASSDEVMVLKQQLLEGGRIELSKLSEPKLEFSMDMANIYALDEFQPIINQFQLGNLINVILRKDYVKRARLLEVNINFDDFSDFSCEFGELTNLRTPSSIHADLLANALSAGKSVASNASYWNKGADLATATDMKIQEGLLNTGLYTSDQSITINNNGILLRKVNEDGTFSPNQTLLKNNTIRVTTDGSFDDGSSSDLALGEFTIDGQTFYGIIAKRILSGYVESSTIVGGTINIGNGTFMVDTDGNVTINAGTIKGYAQNDNLISSINASPEEIAIDSSKISLTGKDIDLTSDNITINSTNFSVTADGQITAKNGKIANWTISTNRIYSQNEDGTYNSINTQGGSSFAFAVGAESLSVTTGAPFRVTQAGKLYATDAVINGDITATSGTIAGWDINASNLQKIVTVDNVDYSAYIQASTGNAAYNAFCVRTKDSSDTEWTTQFSVNYQGKLTSKNADIEGKITATSGSIGGWGITDSRMYSCSSASNTEANALKRLVISSYNWDTANRNAISVQSRSSTSDEWTSNFRVRYDGSVYMNNATITGNSSIAGWTVTVGRIYAKNTDGTYNSMNVESSSSYAFAAGASSLNDTSSAPFWVKHDGSVKMSKATITGDSTIAAACIPNLSASKITSGTIDTDRLSSSVITTSNFSAKTLSTGNLTVDNGCYVGSWYIGSGGLTSGNVHITTNALVYGVRQCTWADVTACVESYSSDIRLKNSVNTMDDRYSSLFDSLSPITYKFNSDGDSAKTRIGFIAQDVQKAISASGLENLNCVYSSEGTEEEYLRLSYTDFIALNTWQIQKLKARVEELETKFAALES